MEGTSSSFKEFLLAVQAHATRKTYILCLNKFNPSRQRYANVRRTVTDLLLAILLTLWKHVNDTTPSID